MAELSWDDAAGRRGRPHIKILRVRPGQWARALLLAPPVGIWLHWAEGASTPCACKGCRHCAAGGRPYHRWYAPGCLNVDEGGRPEWKRMVVELNEGNLEALERHDCAGLQVDLQRANYARAPLFLRVADEGKQYAAAGRAEMVARHSFDVRAALLWIWGMVEPETPAAEGEAGPAVIPFEERKQA